MLHKKSQISFYRRTGVEEQSDETLFWVRVLWDISTFAWPTYPLSIRGDVGRQYYVCFGIGAERI